LAEADLAAQAEATHTTLPAGSVLCLRLESAVSTKTSHLRDAVTARVVREVPALPSEKGIAVPVGTIVRGLVEKLIPSSSPTDRARLRLRFTQLEVPGRAPVALAVRVTEVENARESILADGTVQGVLASELPLTMLKDALDRLRKSRSDIGTEAQKAQE
jgi:hypothetical protein